jgi:hypothetical protein
MALQSNERGLTRSSVEEDKSSNQFGDFKRYMDYFDSLQELQKPQEQQQHSKLKEPIKFQVRL